MNESEKIRFGRSIKYNLVFDAKLKKNVYLKSNSVVYSTYYGHDEPVKRNDVFMKNMYHVSKATASHKDLKRAGILK